MGKISFLITIIVIKLTVFNGGAFPKKLQKKWKLMFTSMTPLILMVVKDGIHLTQA